MRDGWLQKWEYISISQRNTFLLHEEIHLVKDEFHWSQKWFIAVLHSTHTWHDILLSVVPFCVLAFCHKWIMEESLLKLTYFSSISVLFKNSQKLDFSRNLQCKKSQQLKTICINFPFFFKRDGWAKYFSASFLARMSEFQNSLIVCTYISTSLIFHLRLWRSF